jgi:hypothetical protein
MVYEIKTKESPMADKKATMERMKKLIEEKKMASAKQGYSHETSNDKVGTNKKAFKTIKRGGAGDK